MPRPKLFISHISKETELAQMLKKHVARDFLDIWDIFVSSDGRSILGGDKWLDELSEALKGAKVEIVLCSKESITRPWVNFEAGAGWIRNIAIVPVCHSDIRPEQLPVPLSMLQALEVSKPEGVRALYETLASKTAEDMQVPAADFESIAAEVRSLEEKYRRTETSVVRVEEPRVLCAASAAYAEIGFDGDAEVLEKFFPGRVVVERKLTSRRLRQLFTTERFDIIHLVNEVDLVTGDLILGPKDRMTGRGFATLLGEAKSELVVLGTCHALSLAVEVAQITNVIATAIDVEAIAVATWAEVFYEFLAGGNSLYKAFNLTNTQNDTPMRLVRKNDVLFGRKGAPNRAAVDA